MSPFIRQYLSRDVVKIRLGYNKALGTVTALYQSATGGSSSSEVQISLPQSEKSRVRPDELTDVEVEQAMLFDYFDTNLPTLNMYLSDSAKVMVMSRAWKEMLGNGHH